MSAANLVGYVRHAEQYGEALRSAAAVKYRWAIDRAWALSDSPPSAPGGPNVEGLAGEDEAAGPECGTRAIPPYLPGACFAGVAFTVYPDLGRVLDTEVRRFASFGWPRDDAAAEGAGGFRAPRFLTSSLLVSVSCLCPFRCSRRAAPQVAVSAGRVDKGSRSRRMTTTRPLSGPKAARR
jgi:hypothetical protein